jgi:signal transduction histidine kinase
MIGRRVASLQLRLALRLAVLYIAATVVVVGVLVYRAYDTAGTLHDRELSLRATDLADRVAVDAGGAARLDLPPRLKAAYEAGDGDEIFAIHGMHGIVAAMPPSFGRLTAGWPRPTEDPSYFRISDPDIGDKDYYGLSIELDSAAGALSVSVARAAGAETLIRSLLREFVYDMAWLIPAFVAVTLAIGVLAIRSGLKPVRAISEMASGIGPNTASVRLPETDLPSEIVPLVTAVNRALDRLDQGFAVQRQFTANAAHELRTPLAIVTAALDTMDQGAALGNVKRDVARMSRLVGQLLSVARLDAIAMDVSRTVDLNEVAAGTIATMAPWALANGASIALGEAEGTALVRGNAHAIEDALRNLLENAIAHSPSGAEVDVTVTREGSLRVADRGPGISSQDRDRIFERFWRGPGARTCGAGLGLSIVSEIMRAHAGRVRVEEQHGGGAVFVLCFRPVDAAARNVSGPPQRSGLQKSRAP